MDEEKEEAGKCPKCSSNNLDYSAICVQDNQVYYPFICNDCKHSDNEYHALEFIGFN